MKKTVKIYIFFFIKFFLNELLTNALRHSLVFHFFLLCFFFPSSVRIADYHAYAVAGCYKTALADPVALLGLAGLHVSDWFIFTILQYSCFIWVHVIMFGFIHDISLYILFLLWIVKKGNEMILGCSSLRSTLFFTYFPPILQWSPSSVQ